MKNLNKVQALQLLPAVVDQEATDDELLAFYAFIKENDDIRKQYESAIRIKKILKSQYKKEQAPESLKEKVIGLISEMEWENNSGHNVVHTREREVIQGKTPDSSKEQFKREPLFNFRLAARYVVAAAVILVLTFVTIELLDQTSYTVQPDFLSIEQTTFDHFSSTSPFQTAGMSIVPQTLDDAIDFLSDEMSHPLRMPVLNGAEIREVRYAEFTEGFSTPVIEFHQKEIDESIFIVAFNIDEIEGQKEIVRDPEAVKHCQTYDDYHILDVEGKHIVSWKWGDYWYTAISNHNGNDLISLVTPQGYNDELSSGSAW